MKYALECTSFALSPPCWATQLSLGKPSVTHNERLLYTWDSAAAAESQRPLYEAALGLKFKVVLLEPDECRLEEESEKFKAY